MTATLFIQNLKTVRALRVSSCVIPNNKNRSTKPKQRWTKRKHFCANAYVYLRNEQVEVAKVSEFLKENIEFGRSV